jgi:hypothetical protein
MISGKEKWKKLLTNNMTYKGPSKFRDPNPLIRANEQKQNQDFKSQFLELKKDYEQLKDKVNKANTKEDTGQGSARQICIAFYYMRECDKAPEINENLIAYAGFINFVSGIGIENLRKRIENPLDRQRNEEYGRSTKELLKDLHHVEVQFNKIGFTQGIQRIQTDIETLKNDLKSFKEK